MGLVGYYYAKIGDVQVEVPVIDGFTMLNTNFYEYRLNNLSAGAIKFPVLQNVHTGDSVSSSEYWPSNTALPRFRYTRISSSSYARQAFAANGTAGTWGGSSGMSGRAVMYLAIAKIDDMYYLVYEPLIYYSYSSSHPVQIALDRNPSSNSPGQASTIAGADASIIVITGGGSIYPHGATLEDLLPSGTTYTISPVITPGISSYTITVNGSSVTSAAEGSIVYVGPVLTEAAIARGATIESIECWYVIPGTDGERQLVPLTESGTGYTFTMPAYPVTIRAYTNYDPNSDGGGGSVPIPGGGDQDDTSDNIDFPELPSLSAHNAGMISLFKIDTANLRLFSDFLWSDNWVWDTLKKLFADPMQFIIALNVVPSDVPVNETAERLKFYVFDTDAYANRLKSQYITVDCGAVEVPSYWGNCLDYSPYTSAKLFLPYVGWVPLDIDDIMGGLVHVKYNIDTLTGGSMAMVKVTRSDHSAVMYDFPGQCVANIPVTGADFSRVIAGILGIVGTAVGVATGAGAAGAAAASSTISTLAEKAAENAGSEAASNALAGGASKTAALKAGREAKRLFDQSNYMPSAAEQTAVASAQGAAFNASIVSAIPNAALSTVANVMGMKMDVSRGGGMSGNNGLLGRQKPSLVLVRPRQSSATNYKHFFGYPSNVTVTLSSLNGYTEMMQVELTNMTASAQEIAEIQVLLKGGVYF